MCMCEVHYRDEEPVCICCGEQKGEQTSDEEDENKGIAYKHNSCLIWFYMVVKLHIYICQKWNFNRIHQNTVFETFVVHL